MSTLPCANRDVEVKDGTCVSLDRIYRVVDSQTYVLFLTAVCFQIISKRIKNLSWFSSEHMAPDFVRDCTFLCAVTPVCWHVRAVLWRVMLPDNLENTISLDTGMVSQCWPSNCNSCTHIS